MFGTKKYDVSESGIIYKYVPLQFRKKIDIYGNSSFSFRRSGQFGRGTYVERGRI